MTAAPRVRPDPERRSAPLPFARSRALSDATRLWRALSEAADRASGDSIGLPDVDERRLRLRMAVERVVHRSCGFDELPEMLLQPVYDEELRVLRAEFLGGMQRGTATIDVRTLAAAVSAFDSLLEEAETEALSGDELIEVAHDMQSPLSSILFLSEALRTARSGSVNQVQERQLGLIYGAAFGLSTLVSDLLDSARGHRLLAGDPLPFSVREMMQHVSAIVRPVAEEKKLALETIFPVIDARVGYAPAIARVLLNLTTNALKSTEHGSVSIGCSDLSSREAEFWVADTGCGLPESLQMELRGRGARGDARASFSSAGLGLGICRTLLDAMGSCLDFQTGHTGTRFSFCLDLPAVRRQA